MTLRVRHVAGVVAMLAACASTNEPDGSSTSDDGGTVLPSLDGSTATDAGDGRDGGASDASLGDAAPRICSDDDFCHSVVPAGTQFRGAWGDGTGVLWAVTLGQDILRWDGAVWNVQYHSDAPISAIWGSGPTDLWVVTTDGLLHGVGTTSATVSFSPGGYMPGDQAAWIKSVWGTGPLDVWAVGGVESTVTGMSGRVLHYVDDPDLGTRWQLDTDLSALNVAFRGVWGTPGSGVWLQGVQKDAGNNVHPQLLHRAPGASSWTSIGLPDGPGLGHTPLGIDGASMGSDNSIWLLGQAAGLMKVLWHGTSADGGVTFTWTVSEQDSLRPPYALWGVAPNDAWAVGGTGLVTHWDGSTWKQAAIRVSSTVVSQSLWAIWGTSNDDFWALGDGVALHRTHAGKP